MLITTTRSQLQEQQQEIAQVAAVQDDGGASMRAQFLADNPMVGGDDGDDDFGAAAVSPMPVTEDPLFADDDTDPVDGDDADPVELEPAEAIDATALSAAVASGDPERLIDALGDKAEELLGTKAHKTLRLTLREIKQTRDKLVKASENLKAEFGDPVAARNAAAKGPEGADDAVAAVERFFGTDWASIVKYVNASFAGKPARLEAKARAEQTAQTAAQTVQQAAQGRVRESIVAELKKSDPKLLEADPEVVELVFAKIRDGAKKGVDTPAKALALVKAELRKKHEALSKVFSTERKRAPEIRPPTEVSGKRGKPMTDEEFRQDFLRSERRAQLAAKAKRGAK